MPGEEGPFHPTDGEADPPPVAPQPADPGDVSTPSLAAPSPVPLEPVGTGDFGWDPRSPAAPVTPVPPPPETASVEERKAALAQAIAGQIAQGYRLRATEWSLRATSRPWSSRASVRAIFCISF